MPKSDIDFDPTLYASVAERLALFWAKYPTGRIETRLVGRNDTEVVFEALIFRDRADPLPAATGWAREREGDGDINTVACLENTETSAVGRALANLGFTAARERPSLEEMEKAARVRRRQRVHVPGERPAPPAILVVSEQRSRYARAETLDPYGLEPAAPREKRVSALTPLPRGDALQHRADEISDALALVRAAERLGLRPARAESCRQLLAGRNPSREDVGNVSRVLQRWIAKRRHEVPDGV